MPPDQNGLSVLVSGAMPFPFRAARRETMRHLTQLQFLPSDIEPANLESIRAWVRSAQLPNLQEPLTLDVCASDYGVGSVEALLSANLLHIAPWHCAEGLFEGARRHLAAAGVLVIPQCCFADQPPVSKPG